MILDVRTFKQRVDEIFCGVREKREQHDYLRGVISLGILEC